jgi:hypothetical protein
MIKSMCFICLLIRYLHINQMSFTNRSNFIWDTKLNEYNLSLAELRRAMKIESFILDGTKM